MFKIRDDNIEIRGEVEVNIFCDKCGKVHSVKYECEKEKKCAKCGQSMHDGPCSVNLK